MVTSSNQLGAVPRTPTRPTFRRFGTVLSVNSPIARTPSTRKKGKSTALARSSIPEESIVFENHSLWAPSASSFEYTVSFDVGPIGLHLDPATCRVQRIVGENSPAAKNAGLIEAGDRVVAIDGVRITSYTDALETLRNTSIQRRITFARPNTDDTSLDEAIIVPEMGPENPSFAYPGRAVRRQLLHTPTRTGTASPMQPIAYRNSPNNASLIKGIEAANPEELVTPSSSKLVPLLTPSNVSKPAFLSSDEIELTRRELEASTHIIQLLQNKVESMESENMALRQRNQQFNAIKEMEFKMRLTAAEEELISVKASKSKLKDRIVKLEQQMSTNEMDAGRANQELERVLTSSKDAATALDKMQSELASTKNDLIDSTSQFQREKDMLSAQLSQLSANHERSVAAKLQAESQIQQLEMARCGLDNELQRARSQQQESESHASAKTDQLLNSLKKKDEQLEELRLALVSAHSEMASKDANLTKQEDVGRTVNTELDQLKADKSTMASDYSSLSSILEAKLRDNELLETQLSKLEARISEQHHSIERLGSENKQSHEDFCVRLAEKDEALALSAESIDSLYQAKESVTKQLAITTEQKDATTERESQLAVELETLIIDTSSFRKESAAEKCNLLKQIEELEGTVLQFQQEQIVHEQNRSALREELAAARNKIATLIQDVTDTKKELFTANDSLDRTSALLTQTKAKLSDTSSQLSFSQARIETLKTEVSISEGALEVTRREAERATEIHETFRSNTVEARKVLEKQIDEQSMQMTTQICRIESLEKKLEDSNYLVMESKQNLEEILTSFTTTKLELDQTRTEHSLSLAACTSLTIDLTAARELVDSWQRSVESLQGDLDDKRIQLSEANALAFQLQSGIASLEVEVSELAQKNHNLLDHCEDTKQEYNVSIVQHKQRIDELEGGLSGACSRLVFANSTLESTTTKLTEVETQLSETNSKLLSSLSRTEQLESDLSTSEVKLADALGEADLANEIYKCKANEATKRHALMENEIENKSNILAAKLSQIESLENELRISSHTVDTTKQCLKDAKAALVVAQAELCQSKAAHTLSNSTCNELTEELIASTAEVESLRLSVERLRSDLDTERNELLETRDSVYHLRSENTSLSVTISEIQKTNEGLLKQIDDDRLESTVAMKRNEQFVKALERDYSDTDTKLKKSTDKLQETMAKLDHAEMELAETRADLLSSHACVESMSATQTLLNANLSTCEVCIAKLRTENDDLTVLAESLRTLSVSSSETTKEVRMEAESLRSQLAKSEADFQQSHEQESQNSESLQLVLQKLSVAQDRNCKLLHELQQSESNLDSINRLVESSNAQIAGLRDTLSKKQRQMESERQEGKQALCHKSGEVKLLEGQLENVVHQNDELQTQLLRLSTAWETDTKNRATVFAAALSSANDTEKDLSKQIETLKRDILDQQVSRGNMEERTSEVNRELLVVKLENGALRSKLVAIETSLKEANLHSSVLQNSLASAESRESSAKEFAVSIQCKMDEVDARLSDACLELINMTNKETSLASENAKIYKEIDDLRAGNKHLSNEVKALRVALDDKDSCISLCRQETAEMKDAWETSSKELAHKTTCLETSGDDLVESRMRLTDFEARFKATGEESAKYRTAIMADFSRLEEENVRILTENVQMDELVHSMGKKSAQLESLLDEAREKIYASQAAFNSLTESSDTKQSCMESQISLQLIETSKYRDLTVELTNDQNSLTEENKMLRAKVDGLVEQLDSASIRFQSQESTLVQGNDMLLIDLYKEREKVASLLEQEGMLKTAHAKALHDAVHTQDDLKEHIRRLIYEAELTTKQHSLRLDDYTKNENAYHQCREELCCASNELERTRKELEDQISTSVVSENEAIRESQSHNVALLSLRGEKDNLAETLKKVQDALQSSERRVEEEISGNSLLRADLAKASVEKVVLKRTVHDVKDALVELQCDLEKRQNTSTDSISVTSPFKQLARHEIAEKCALLQDDLLLLTNQKDELEVNFARRLQHLHCLSSDLASLSSEVESLLEANGLLEARLRDTAYQKAHAEESLESSQKGIVLVQSQLQNLTTKLDAALTENQALTDELRQNKNQAMAQHLESVENTHKLETELSVLENQKKSISDQFAQQGKDLSVATAERDNLLGRINDIEKEILCLKSEQVANVKELEASKEAERKNLYYESVLLLREEEISSLRLTVSKLELDIRSLQHESEQNHESKRDLLAALERLRDQSSLHESGRADIVQKLAEASRVVMLQKETINRLETRATEAERKASAVSDTLKEMQISIARKETSTHAGYRTTTIHNLETKCVSLQKERTVLEKEASDLRDVVRATKREHTTLSTTNSQMQTRLESLKHALEATKVQLTETKAAKEDSRVASRKLEVELDSKQIEVEHLKAKLQVLTASTARAKAKSLLKDHHMDNEVSESSMQKIATLEIELNSKSCKLESLSEVYRSQQQVLRLSQSLENQLIRFIQEVIHETDIITGKFASRSEKLYSFVELFNVSNGVKALDLAGFEKPDRNLALFRANLDSLTLLVPQAISQLRERKEQLTAWKLQRSDRSGPFPSTPDPKSRSSVPDTPAIRDTFERMKTVLNNEIQSPRRIAESGSNKCDVDCLRKVILTLEAQIDVLLCDLQAANDALKAKEDLYADLEQLVANHEEAFDVLHQKLSDSEKRIIEAESDKDIAQRELTSWRGSLSNDADGGPKHADASSCKLAAGRLLIRTLESRSHVAKAVVFRKWACQTSALMAVAKQGCAAAALARQLEETREKLVILKRHLKKTRRGPRDCGGLNSIPEQSNESVSE